MADNFKFFQTQAYSLAGSGNAIGATSITLTSMKDIDGNAITMSSAFGTKGFGTIEPNNSSREEQIVFTGLTNNANGTTNLTGISNVTFASPYTETSGTLKSHPGGAIFVISNTSGFYDELTSKNDDETIAGTWTFTNPNYPRMDTQTPSPTDPQQLVTKAYADGLAIAGAPNASTSVQGLVQAATQAQADAKTQTGSTGALLFQQLNTQRNTLESDYIVDTGAADAYVIAPSPAITAYATGQIFNFKAATTNTTTSTVNVNGLGVKTIKKADGTINLAAGNIVAGQIITIEYNAVSGFFQMMNPVGNGDVELAGAQTVAGLKTFTALPQSAATPTVAADLTTKVYADAIVGSFVGTPFNSGTVTTTVNQDTTYAPGFTAKNITIYYALQGVNSGTAQYSYGIATYNGASIVSNYILKGNLATNTLATGIPATSTSNPVAGLVPGTNCMLVTLSITSVTSTQFIVRAAFQQDSANAGIANFYVTATK